ncbi:tRNA (adenosine(37)-N6)-threonylcarbamoyltransferase complex transferase subunit TsaD [Candidatus Microgenomates bacterium]|nr:tRNA (adenosine(37)-N6)-threonylcarbamoyltransferase complex transferase subunit TsaD [Candidatus Microgenomates bacterium]
MKILGIETSCDETAVDAIAVTVGPGLIGSLLVGVETAKTLVYVWKKPIIPVNHLVGHIYANWITNHLPGVPQAQHHLEGVVPQFPVLALVVSGGHTDLVLMKNHGELKWLGGTRDDAAGEAFDKIGRLLGLPYPGGPAIAAEAAKFPAKGWSASGGKYQIKLPRPLLDSEDFDFSFSGLKTAVLREVNRIKVEKQFNNLTIQQLSSEVQQAIVDVLIAKTIRAAQKYRVKSILLGGGVAANQKLREQLKLEIKNLKLEIPFFVPEKWLCTDNAAMIAAAAFFNDQEVLWEKIKVDPNLHFAL